MDEKYIQQCRDAFEKLFQAAKTKEEFEYVCSMMRIRGMEDAGWDPLQETDTLVNEMGSLMNAPLKDFTRIRLGLLTYCHITEVDAIYLILENLVNTTEGKRCIIDPFIDYYVPLPKNKRTSFRTKRPPSAATVVNLVMEHAKEAGFPEIAEVLDLMFDDNVRNAFYHSDYILYQDEFRSRHPTFKRKLSEVVELMNRGFSFYLTFMETYSSHIKSYKENKIVLGRIQGDSNPPVEIELLGDPERGLHGFRSPPSKDKAA